MSTTSKRTTPRPLITRYFESSRRHRDNLAAAFEHALPVIRRGLVSGPASVPPRHADLASSRRERAIS